MNKTLTDLASAYRAFPRKHPFLALLVSLVMMAACLGAFYLIYTNYHSISSLSPCLFGGCSG